MSKSTFILALCLLFVLPACNIFSDEFLSSPLSDQDIIRFVGAPLPDSATNAMMRGESALDTMVILRFDLPTSEVDNYIAALNIPEANLRQGYTPFLSDHPPYAVEWWNVDTRELSQPAYRGLYGQIGNKYYQVLAISMGEITTLYLQIFNT